MNNLTLAVLLGACTPILSMESGILMKQETVVAKESSTITIQNETLDCLEVLVKYAHQEELIRLRVEPNQEATISETAKIEKLYALRYGRLLKWTNLSQLTLGLVGPYNIMGEQLLCHLISHNVPARVTIKRGNRIVEALTDDSNLRWAAALISPYLYEISSNESESEKNDFRDRLFEFFPRVQRAKEENQLIYPRYFLDLPEYAEAHAVRSAYERVKAFWEQNKNEAIDPERIRLANQALAFVKAAWKSLSRGGEYTDAFNTLVLAEIDAPTAYLFEQAPLTAQQIADLESMGWTFNKEDSSALDHKGDGQNNNNDFN